MKKWLTVIVVLGLLAIGWTVARQQVMVPIWAQPKLGKITRGDIDVPITAAGLIHPDEVIEVKSMASGRITAVPVIEGDFVKGREPVVVLDPIDEQRAYDRAKAELDRADALLSSAEVAVDKAGNAIETAKARHKDILIQLDYAKYEYDRVKDLVDREIGSNTELKERTTQYNSLVAQKQIAETEIRAAELAKLDAAAAVRSQMAIVEAAQKTLEDAKKRLDETTVLSPRDAIVTDVVVRPGMLVQSATGSFVGGTLLMKIADVSRKKVVARLDEADYGRVLAVSPINALPDMPELRAAAEQDAETLEKRTGTVKITVDAFPELEFAGRIERVEPQGNLNAGSSVIQFDVVVEITDPRRHMLPLGAQAQVEFTVQSAKNALLVPAEAVKTHEEQRGVYVKIPGEGDAADPNGRRFVPCRFGISDGERTQVLAVVGAGELKEGDDVFTKLPQNPDEQGS